MNEILSLFTSSMSSVINWFSSVFDRTGAAPIYLGIIVIFMSMRYIISPITGGSLGGGLGSDVARFVRREEKDNG